MPEPAAPPSYDPLRLVEPHPDLTEARLNFLTQIRRLGGVEQKEGLVERMERLTEMRRQRTGV